MLLVKLDYYSEDISGATGKAMSLLLTGAFHPSDEYALGKAKKWFQQNSFSMQHHARRKFVVQY